MTDKEAMKLALFALDIVKIHYTQNRHVNEAITALKERLAQPEQEPVAWRWETHNGYAYSEQHYEGEDGQPLYTTPPQRTWVGLMRGVRVDGDTVVITVKGGNEAARKLCAELLKEKNL